MPRLSGPHEGRHLIRCRRTAIGGSAAPRCDGQRDPPAPGQARLSRFAGIRIGQGVARHLIHQDEGIEDRCDPARLQRPDRLDHRGIRRRAAIDRSVVLTRHEARLPATDIRDPPRHRIAIGFMLLDHRLHLAGSAAQVVAEPRHNQADRPALWQFFTQRGDRGGEIRDAAGRIHVDRLLLAKCHGQVHLRRRQRIFARPRDQRDPLYRTRDVGQMARRARLRRPHHLEAELRHAVTELVQRQVLEHDIGRATISRRMRRSFHRNDLRIRQLGLRAAIDPHVQRQRRDLFPVRPDTAHPRDLAFAQRHRNAHCVAVGRRRGLRPGPLAAAGRRRGLGEPTCPDDMAADPHPAVNARDCATFTGARQPEPVDAADLDRLASGPKDALVDHPPQHGPRRAADRRHRQAQQRPADRPAQRHARSRKYQRRHELSLLKFETRHDPPGPRLRQRAFHDPVACVGVNERRRVICA